MGHIKVKRMDCVRHHSYLLKNIFNCIMFFPDVKINLDFCYTHISRNLYMKLNLQMFISKWEKYLLIKIFIRYVKCNFLYVNLLSIFIFIIFNIAQFFNILRTIGDFNFRPLIFIQIYVHCKIHVKYFLLFFSSILLIYSIKWNIPSPFCRISRLMTTGATFCCLRCILIRYRVC